MFVPLQSLLYHDQRTINTFRVRALGRGKVFLQCASHDDFHNLQRDGVQLCPATSEEEREPTVATTSSSCRESWSQL